MYELINDHNRENYEFQIEWMESMMEVSSGLQEWITKKLYVSEFTASEFNYTLNDVFNLAVDMILQEVFAMGMRISEDTLMEIYTTTDDLTILKTLRTVFDTKRFSMLLNGSIPIAEYLLDFLEEDEEPEDDLEQVVAYLFSLFPMSINLERLHKNFSDLISLDVVSSEEFSEHIITLCRDELFSPDNDEVVDELLSKQAPLLIAKIETVPPHKDLTELLVAIMDLKKDVMRHIFLSEQYIFKQSIKTDDQVMNLFERFEIDIDTYVEV